MKDSKLLISFCYWLQDVRAFKVFKWTVGCVFKCDIEQLKLAKNIKIGFLRKSFFVYCSNILSNTYVILVFENFSRSPLIKTQQVSLLTPVLMQITP